MLAIGRDKKYTIRQSGGPYFSPLGFASNIDRQKA